MDAGNSELAKHLLRQRERTIDNVKRLFAVVFALSYTVAGRNAFEKILPVLNGERLAPIPWQSWFANIETLAVFTVTAAVFYHQGAKFLDWRYASGSHDEAHPLGFAWDFFTLITTMVPFILMANSLDPRATSKAGFTAFFFSYILLLTWGLVLLVLAEMRHTNWFRSRVLRDEKLSEGELRRDSALRRYWLLMNSIVVLVIAIVFGVDIWSGDTCPTRTGAHFPSFLAVFGVIALSRDWLDFAWSWPVLYPVRSDTPRRWPISWIENGRGYWKRGNVWTLAGLFFLGSYLYVAYLDSWWDYSRWAKACT